MKNKGEKGDSYFRPRSEEDPMVTALKQNHREREREGGGVPKVVGIEERLSPAIEITMLDWIGNTRWCCSPAEEEKGTPAEPSLYTILVRSLPPRVKLDIVFGSPKSSTSTSAWILSSSREIWLGADLG